MEHFKPAMKHCMSATGHFLFEMEHSK